MLPHGEFGRSNISSRCILVKRTRLMRVYTYYIHKTKYLAHNISRNNACAHPISEQSVVMRHVILHPPRIEDLLRRERNPIRLEACQLRISGHGDQPALYCIAPHHWVAQLRPYGSLEVVRVQIHPDQRVRRGDGHRPRPLPRPRPREIDGEEHQLVQRCDAIVDGPVQQVRGHGQRLQGQQHSQGRRQSAVEFVV